MRFYSDIISVFVVFEAIIWVLFRKKRTCRSDSTNCMFLLSYFRSFHSAGYSSFSCGSVNFSNFGIFRSSIFQSLSSLIIAISIVPTILST